LINSRGDIHGAGEAILNAIVASRDADQEVIAEAESITEEAA
jgi:hypothetical protein